MFKVRYLDRESLPESRGAEKCINCGCTWRQHAGWLCETLPGAEVWEGDKKSDIPPNFRYLTEDMLSGEDPFPLCRKRESANEVR